MMGWFRLVIVLEPSFEERETTSRHFFEFQGISTRQKSPGLFSFCQNNLQNYILGIGKENSLAWLAKEVPKFIRLEKRCWRCFWSRFFFFKGSPATLFYKWICFLQGWLTSSPATFFTRIVSFSFLLSETWIWVGWFQILLSIFGLKGNDVQVLVVGSIGDQNHPKLGSLRWAIYRYLTWLQPTHTNSEICGVYSRLFFFFFEFVGHVGQWTGLGIPSQKTNMTTEHPPWMKMYFLLKNGDFLMSFVCFPGSEYE